MEENVDLLEMGESQNMDEESKLHNNSIEEEKRLKEQFMAISKLCTSDTKSFSISWPWKRPTDEVIYPIYTFQDVKSQGVRRRSENYRD